jgi:hypothetical protein
MWVQSRMLRMLRMIVDIIIMLMRKNTENTENTENCPTSKQRELPSCQTLEVKKERHILKRNQTTRLT